MPQYEDVEGSPLSEEEALPRTRFTLKWVDGVSVTCTRRGYDSVWTVVRTVNGIQAAYGTVTQSNHAFRRNGSQNVYNTFADAARRIVEPV